MGVAAELKGMGVRERTIRSDLKSLGTFDITVLTTVLFTIAAVICCEIWLSHVWMPTGGVAAMP